MNSRPLYNGVIDWPTNYDGTQSTWPGHSRMPYRSKGQLTAHEEARLHLAEAREFLNAAETSRDLGLDNAAASDGVISAINSKDAICLALTGRTGKSDDHAQAVDELRRSGGRRAGVDSESAPQWT